MLKPSSEPLLRQKQAALDIQDLVGSWNIHWKISDITLLSTVYTRVDQVFVLWGVVAIVMFTVAQFLPISWTTQALLWSVLTTVGTAYMLRLTYFWAQVERLTWLIYAWAALLLLGVVVTDVGIFFNVGTILINLCPLWLGLSAIGYLITGVGIQSRTFIWGAFIHLIGIGVLQCVSAWQLGLTGGIIGGSLICLAQVQWDMRPPIDYALLTEEQRTFNHQQSLLRQVN